MKCPVCENVNLAMMDKQGIEIDYCPQCRGIWLDRGELDKLIEKVDSGFSNSDSEVKQPEQNNYNNQQPQKKKEGLGGILGDFMDFG